jgi:hypothetical protein
MGDGKRISTKVIIKSHIPNRVYHERPRNKFLIVSENNRSFHGMGGNERYT